MSTDRPAAEERAMLAHAHARSRLNWVASALVSLLLVVAARGVQLSLAPSDFVEREAASKRWNGFRLAGARGDILDRSGNRLAMSVKGANLSVDLGFLRREGFDERETARALAEILGVSEASLIERFASVGDRSTVRVARRVHPAVVQEVRALPAKLAVVVEPCYERFYPHGTLASQLLGFVDADGRGRQGLEAHFNDALSGGYTIAKREVLAGGILRHFTSRDTRPIEGQAIRTTIDSVIQAEAERSLRKVIERSEPVAATVVVVEVRTGHILAMATAPSFDPNRVAKEDPAHTINRAITDAIEPGSVFKVFTMAAAIDAGKARFDEVLDTSVPFRVGRSALRDDHYHASVTVAEMVKYSSNIGAAQLASRVGAERLVDYFRDFGFGEPSGIPTQGERRGMRHPPGRLGAIELATISYGQGTTATALQLAMATAAIGNGGKRMEPVLVTEVRDAYNRVHQRSEPRVAARVVNAEAAADVLRAMEMVTGEGGTGTRARVPGYRVAGKTGTSWKVKDGRYSSSARYATFIGLAPAQDPDLAVAVIVDEPTVGSRYGGTVAAPVFADVMAAALPHRGIEPDPALLDAQRSVKTARAAQAEVPARQPARLDWDREGWRIPDLTGRSMRDALAALQGAGLNVEIDGSGFVAAQLPGPGAIVRRGGAVMLRLEAIP